MVATPNIDVDPEPGFFDYRPTCSKCGRFVKQSAVEPIAYHADSGLYGEVIDGHGSHPECGDRVPVAFVVRWVPCVTPNPVAQPGAF